MPPTPQEKLHLDYARRTHPHAYSDEGSCCVCRFPTNHALCFEIMHGARQSCDLNEIREMALKQRQECQRLDKLKREFGSIFVPSQSSPAECPVVDGSLGVWSVCRISAGGTFTRYSANAPPHSRLPPSHPIPSHPTSGRRSVAKTHPRGHPRNFPSSFGRHVGGTLNSIFHHLSVTIRVNSISIAVNVIIGTGYQVQQ